MPLRPMGRKGPAVADGVAAAAVGGGDGDPFDRPPNSHL